MNMKQYVRSVLLSVLLLAGSPVQAQIYYPEVTFKESLTRLLFQYGREVFYRGVDPQEASYVFQRIILLDCDHHGAQEFLAKIAEKYPEVSIKIRNCSQVKPQQKFTKTVEFKNADNEEDLVVKSEEKYLPGPHVPALIREDMRLKPNKEPDMSVLIGSEPVETDFALTEGSQTDDLTRSAFERVDELANELKESISMSNSLNRDCDLLRSANLKLQNEVLELNTQIRLKDAMIVELQEQLMVYKDRDSVSFASIAEDQQNLIRIQQGNIDYLQKELDDVKEQMLNDSIHDDPDYSAIRNELAASQLLLQENETLLEAKNKEAFLLQKQLGELQEQLRLVKKILVEKNEIIKSLQEEIESR